MQGRRLCARHRPECGGSCSQRHAKGEGINPLPGPLTLPLPDCTVQIIEMESLWPPNHGKNGTIVVSALRARANFGKLLRRVDDERRSLVIEKRGTPKAVLLSIRDYVKLAAPEPEVLRVLGEESERNGTSTIDLAQINKIIKTSRSQKPKR